MTNPSELPGQAGWEPIWRSEDIPPRYRSFAAPNPTIVEWADTLPKESLLLDVGCGVGRHLIYLGERGFRLAGVDVSPTGIQLARNACAERGIEVDSQVSDMTALPWPDLTFDGAFSTSTIHHHRRHNIVKTLDEIKRVLKPGASLLVDFPCTDTLAYLRLRKQVADGQISEVEPNTFVDERPDSDDPDGKLPHHFCDEADLRDLLGNFEIVRLWADLRDHTSENGETGRIGKWVAWCRKPLYP